MILNEVGGSSHQMTMTGYDAWQLLFDGLGTNLEWFFIGLISWAVCTVIFAWLIAPIYSRLLAE